MKQYALLGIVCLLCSFAVYAGIIRNSGRIAAVVTGSGRVSAIECFGSPSNHMNSSFIYVRDNIGAHEPVDMSDTQKTYPLLQMVTGFGASAHSNYFYCTASYIPGESTSLYQTVVILSRTRNNASFFHMVDPHMQETPEHDISAVNTGSVNPVLLFNERNVYLGLVALHNHRVATQFMTGYEQDVRTAIEAGFLPNTVTQSDEDAAGALGWEITPLQTVPEKFFSRFYAGATQADVLAPAQQHIRNPRVHVKRNPDELRVRRAVFRHNFLHPNRDMIRVRGNFDITEHAELFDTLNNVDVSLIIGHYRGLTPDEGTKVLRRPRLLIIREDGMHGRKRLRLRLRHRRDDGTTVAQFNFHARRTDLFPATLLNTESPPAQRSPYILPFALMITGSSVNEEKGGHVWIAAQNIDMTYNKRPRRARGFTPIIPHGR